MVLDKKIYELHSDLCETLANPKRLEVLDLLRSGEKTVGELADKAHILQPNLSQHLALLRERGIVTTRRDGVKVYYSIAHPKILQACDLIRQVLYERVGKEGVLIKSSMKVMVAPSANQDEV